MISNTLFPVLGGIDDLMAIILPLLIRISIYGGIAGALAMGIYALASNQTIISHFKSESRRLRKQMLDPDLEHNVFLELTKKNLKVSFALLGRVTGPGLISALPVLLIAVWLQTFFSYALPEKRDKIFVTMSPNHSGLSIMTQAGIFQKEQDTLWIVPSSDSEQIEVRINGDSIYSGSPFTPLTSVISKRKWWHVLLDSEIGYLADEAPIEVLRLELPRKRVLPGVPLWAAGWEWPFFICVLLSSLSIKLIFRLE